jgi:hypothetical protein
MMPTTEPFRDRELRCRRCGERFWWTITQQKYAGKPFPPSQCRPCHREFLAAKEQAQRQALLDRLEIDFDLAIRGLTAGDVQ